jgi:adenylate cyclase
MALSDELDEGVDTYFKGSYDITDGRTIPSVDDIQLGKYGREMELTMLFVDIRESTRIVDGFRRTTAARMYKSFLWGITKIARANDGELGSFNGDGVLVAFSGSTKRTNAVKAGLQMSWFCKNILKPKLENFFDNNYELKDLNFNFGIGIDSGKVLIVRGGMKGENNNDLVWVGNATNYAVKFSSITDEGYNVFISADVYDNVNESAKFNGDPKRNMWESRTFKEEKVYRSNWTWKPS